MSSPLGKKTFAEYKKAIDENKVHLSVVGDLTSATKEVASLTKQYKSEWTETSGSVTEVYLQVEDLRQEYIQLTKRVPSYKTANDNNAKAFQKLIQRQDKVFSAEKLLQQNIQSAKKASSELGVSFKDLPGMSEALDISQWNIDTMNMISKDLSRMSKSIGATDDNILEIVT